jgi:hypothetical protein
MVGTAEAGFESQSLSLSVSGLVRGPKREREGMSEKA